MSPTHRTDIAVQQYCRECRRAIRNARSREAVKRSRSEARIGASDSAQGRWAASLLARTRSRFRAGRPGLRVLSTVAQSLPSARHAAGAGVTDDWRICLGQQMNASRKPAEPGEFDDVSAALRPLLLSIAYEMVGAIGEAEDIVG